MNGARSTFMRKGYWLTALAAVVLLAASPGTALAQSIGFSGTSDSMMEGATPDAKTPAPLVIEIHISGLTLEGDDADREDGLGMITIDHNADLAYPGQATRSGDMQRVWIDGESSALDESETVSDSNLVEHTELSGKYGLPTGGEIHYDNNGVIRLVIIDPSGDGNWMDNDFIMDIESNMLGISASPGSFKVTVTDTSVQPTAKFSKTSVVLTEETQTSVPVAITVGVGMDDDAPSGLATLPNMIQFTTSPAGAAVATCDPNSEKDVIALMLNGITAEGEDDTWQVDGGAGQVSTATIGIEACGDMSGFNDEMVTFSFDADSLKGMPTGYGNVAAGADLVVTVRSEGEDKPTVSFSATRLPITEGDTGTVAILADGKLGPEVGSVMVSVIGDAVLSLWQGTDMLEAGDDDDGMYAVDLGGSANTILTVMADDDPALDDDMTATATVTIESANGADIGTRNSLTVTVSGVTQETDPDAPDPDAPDPDAPDPDAPDPDAPDPDAPDPDAPDPDAPDPDAPDPDAPDPDAPDPDAPGAGANASAAVDCAVAARAWPDGWRRTAAVSAAAAGLVEPIVPESPGG